MTTQENIARARALLAGIKAKMEEGGAPGKWVANGASVEDASEDCKGWTDIAECYLDDRYHLDQEESEANARLIAACHNAMPTALEDIEADLELAEDLIEDTYSSIGEGIVARKLALLETLAREFGVEVGE